MNPKSIKNKTLKVLNKYWNERLCYLAQSDRIDDAEAVYSEFNIDGSNQIYEAFSDDEEILFLEYLNDL